MPDTEAKNDAAGDGRQNGKPAAAAKKADDAGSIASGGSKALSTISGSKFLASFHFVDRLCGTPTTKRGRHFYMITILLIPILPILLLVVQNCFFLNDVVVGKQVVVTVGKLVAKADLIAQLASRLQEERSVVAFYLYIDRQSDNSANKGVNVKDTYKKTDVAIGNVEDWNLPAKDQNVFASKLRFQIRLDDFREAALKKKVIGEREISMEEVMQFYTYATNVLLDYLSRMMSIQASKTWKYSLAYKNLLRAAESVGVEMVKGIKYYGFGSLTLDERMIFIQQHKLASEYIKQASTFIVDMRSYMDKVYNSEDFKFYSLAKNQISSWNTVGEARKNVTLLDKAEQYFKSTISFMTKITGIVNKVRYTMSYKINLELWEAEKQQGYGIFVLIIVAIVSPLIIMIIRSATTALQVFSVSVTTTMEKLKKERKKTDKLLFQMLPPTVAENMRDGKMTSELFECATLGFSSIEGFADIIRSCAPMELVAMINIIYKTYDERIDRHDCYKVETINDTYMVASGLPVRNEDKHVAEMATLCLEMIELMPLIVVPHSPTMRLRALFGIHTGPVVAGVVGSKMPRYCLFGTTVLVASR